MSLFREFFSCHCAKGLSNKPMDYIWIQCLTHEHTVIHTGQKKLGKVITPDPWKSGARNTTGKVLQNGKAHIYFYVTAWEKSVTTKSKNKRSDIVAQTNDNNSQISLAVLCNVLWRSRNRPFVLVFELLKIIWGKTLQREIFSEGGGRKVGENKALTAKKARLVFEYCLYLTVIFFNEETVFLQTDLVDTQQWSLFSQLINTTIHGFFRFAPYETFSKCRICKSSVHQVGSHYCQGRPSVQFFYFDVKYCFCKNFAELWWKMVCLRVFLIFVFYLYFRLCVQER